MNKIESPIINLMHYKNANRTCIMRNAQMRILTVMRNKILIDQKSIE